jgi:hypothetical protein
MGLLCLLQKTISFFSFLWLLPFLILRVGKIPFGEKVVSGYEEKAKGLSFCLLLGTCWVVVVVLR